MISSVCAGTDLHTISMTLKAKAFHKHQWDRLRRNPSNPTNTLFEITQSVQPTCFPKSATSCGNCSAKISDAEANKTASPWYGCCACWSKKALDGGFGWGKAWISQSTSADDLPRMLTVWQQLLLLQRIAPNLGDNLGDIPPSAMLWSLCSRPPWFLRLALASSTWDPNSDEHPSPAYTALRTLPVLISVKRDTDGWSWLSTRVCSKTYTTAPISRNWITRVLDVARGAPFKTARVLNGVSENYHDHLHTNLLVDFLLTLH